MARYTKGGDVVRVPQINAELEKIEQAFENTLSRDGDAPNQMNAPIDMNGNKIVNVQTDITDPNSLVQRSDLYVKSEVDAKDAQAVLDANAFAVNQDNAVLAAAQAYAEELAGEPVNTVRYVQEEFPVGDIISGARWYKPSEGVTYVYYVDGDSSQWVQETVNSFEGTLRDELADADSDVLVGGVEARILADNASAIPFMYPSADDSAAIQLALDSKGIALLTAGSYTLNSEIQIPATGAVILGVGKNLVTVNRGASLSTSNMFYGNSVSLLKIEGITFENGKGVYTPSLSDPYLENVITLDSPKNVDIEKCAFNNFVNRAIAINASNINGAVKINVSENTSSEGSRGFINIVRYGDDITISRNELFNTVDSTVGGIAFEKPISVGGGRSVFIRDNVISSDNGDGGPVIVEYQDRNSKNVHITGNTYTGNINESYYKVGPTENLYLTDNHGSGGGQVGAYLEGVLYGIVENNDFINLRENGIVLAQDADTLINCQYVDLKSNRVEDCNTDLNTVGVPFTSTGSTSSYAIWVQGGSDNIKLSGNKYIDASNKMGGLLIEATNYYIDGEDFSQLDASNVTIDNHFSSPTTPYKITNCIGARTRASGSVTIPSGVGNVNVDPKLLGVFNTFVNISIRGALSGDAAYVTFDGGIPSTFDVFVKNTSHAPATTTADVVLHWESDVSENAVNIFGKTSL